MKRRWSLRRAQVLVGTQVPADRGPDRLCRGGVARRARRRPPPPGRPRAPARVPRSGHPGGAVARLLLSDGSPRTRACKQLVMGVYVLGALKSRRRSPISSSTSACRRSRWSVHGLSALLSLDRIIYAVFVAGLAQEVPWQVRRRSLHDLHVARGSAPEPMDRHRLHDGLRHRLRDLQGQLPHRLSGQGHLDHPVDGRGAGRGHDPRARVVRLISRLRDGPREVLQAHADRPRHLADVRPARRGAASTASSPSSRTG